MIQEETNMSCMSIKFIINTKRSICHATNAFPMEIVFTVCYKIKNIKWENYLTYK